VSAGVLVNSVSLDLPSAAGDDLTGIETAACDVCGHPQEAHRLLLTSIGTYVICHEPTEDGECYRVRHSQGIRFGACRRGSS
jgi:hypothetical protein